MTADFHERTTWSRVPGSRKKHRYCFVLTDKHAVERDYRECQRFLDEVTAWVVDQFGEGKWDQYHYSFYFHSGKQATAFKLRWC